MPLEPFESAVTPLLAELQASANAHDTDRHMAAYAKLPSLIFVPSVWRSGPASMHRSPWKPFSDCRPGRLTSVRVFDAWGVWSHEGAAAWRRSVEGWFTSLGKERVKVTFENVNILGTRELASASAKVTYAGISAEGEPLRTMTNRISWVLRMTGHVCRIVHEHTSAPIGFEDMKAILKRAPAPRIDSRR